MKPSNQGWDGINSFKRIKIEIGAAAAGLLCIAALAQMSPMSFTQHIVCTRLCLRLSLRIPQSRPQCVRDTSPAAGEEEVGVESGKGQPVQRHWISPASTPDVKPVVCPKVTPCPGSCIARCLLWSTAAFNWTKQT